MSITLYTSATCAPCKMLKKYLDMKGVDYKELDGTTVDNLQEVMNLTGQRLFPTMVVDNGDKRAVVSGYNIGKIASLLT